MKINKFISLLAIPFLCSCQQLPDYEGPKLVVDYVENGSLIELQPVQLYDLVITRGKDAVVLFSIDGCSTCEQAKIDFSSYAKGYHMNLYTVNMSFVLPNSDEYAYILNSTTYLDGLYSFPNIEEASYPLAYFYKQKGVALTRQSNFIDALRMYVSTNE